jgi:hypothetical protein
MSGNLKKIILKIATKLFKYMLENKVSFVGGKVVKGGNKLAKVGSVLKTLRDVILLSITIILIALNESTKHDIMKILRHYAAADPEEIIEEIAVNPLFDDARDLVHKRSETEDQSQLSAIEAKIENIVVQGDVDSEVKKIMIDLFGNADDFSVAQVEDDVTLDDIMHDLSEIGSNIDAKIRIINRNYRDVQYYSKDFVPRVGEGEGDPDISDKSKPYKGKVAPVTRFYPKKTVRKIKDDKSWIKDPVKDDKSWIKDPVKEGGSSKKRKRTQKRRKQRK